MGFLGDTCFVMDGNGAWWTWGWWTWRWEVDLEAK